MSGRLSVVPPDAPPDKYAHTILVLDNGHQLRFSDTRKFGKLYLVVDPQTILNKLGPEPLSDAFNAEWLAEQLARRRRAIKPLIMEQSFISGLGNIYADESLYRAGVEPRRPANSRTRADRSFLQKPGKRVPSSCLQREVHGTFPRLRAPNWSDVTLLPGPAGQIHSRRKTRISPSKAFPTRVIGSRRHYRRSYCRGASSVGEAGSGSVIYK